MGEARVSAPNVAPFASRKASNDTLNRDDRARAPLKELPPAGHRPPEHVPYVLFFKDLTVPLAVNLPAHGHAGIPFATSPRVRGCSARNRI